MQISVIIFVNARNSLRFFVYFCAMMIRPCRHIRELILLVFLLLIPSLRPLKAQAPEAAAALVKASQAYSDKDFQQVLSLLTPVVAKDPSLDAAWYYVGMSRLYLREYEQGVEALDKAAALDPTNYWYRYYLSTALFYYGVDPLRGIEGFEKMVQDFPRHADLNYQLADIYIRTGEHAKALDLLEKVEQLMGRSGQVTMLRYELLSSLGRDEEAVQALIDLNDEEPSPITLCEIGNYYQAHDRDTLARDAYAAARALEPSYLPASTGLSEALLSLGDEDGYFALMQEVLSAPGTPVEFSVSYLKGQSNPYARRQFRHPERIDSLAEAVVARHPADSAVLRPAGLYFNSVGNTDRARSLLHQSATAYPHEWDQQLYYIQYLVFLKDFQAASGAAAESFSANPTDVRYLDLKNYADYQLKDYPALLDNARKSMEVAPKGSDEYVSAYANLGDIYHEMGNEAAAFSVYKKVLKIKPDYAPTLNNYAFYLCQKGKKLKKAYNMSRRTIELEPDNSTYLDTFGWILHLMGKDIEAKPIFKQAMLHGGQESAVILDHFAKVLSALGEKDLARVYWRQALLKAGDGEESLKQEIQQHLSAAL